MTEGRIRDVLLSLDGTLDDVRREQAWRTVERSLTVPRAESPRRTWPLAFAGAVAIVLAIVVWPRDHAAPVTTTITELAAADGQQAVFDRDGIVLVLVGPGAATITHGDPAATRIQVTRGTLIADRRDDAPVLTVEAGGNTTTSRDRRFAVRVQPGMVVFGAGEQARASVERHEVTLAPVPAPVPPPVPTPERVAPAPVPPPTPPTARVDRAPTAPMTDTPFPTIKLTATELYKRAEAALRIDDSAVAKELLLRILAEHPNHTLVDAARYDLARIAFNLGEADAALGFVREILTSGTDPRIRIAAGKLRDRIARERRSD